MWSTLGSRTAKEENSKLVDSSRSHSKLSCTFQNCVPIKVSPLNISQQPPQTCTDLNEILHPQDDIYFCHRRQISQESLIPFTRCSILSNCCHKSQLPIQLTSCWRHLWKLMTWWNSLSRVVMKDYYKLNYLRYKNVTRTQTHLVCGHYMDIYICKLS